MLPGQFCKFGATFVLVGIFHKPTAYAILATHLVQEVVVVVRGGRQPPPHDMVIRDHSLCRRAQQRLDRLS